jgi:hypothetical protein
MRKFTIMAFIAIAAFSCNQPSSNSKTTSDKAASDLAGENVKGKVQQVVAETYLIDSVTGKMGKLESKNTEDYDDDGYATTVSNYTSNDSAAVVTKFDHDANGFVTAITTTKNGKPFSSMKIVADSGKYIAATSYDSTGKVDVIYDDISTNEFGQVTGAKGHHADSTLKMSFVNNFDSVYYTGGESKDSVGKTTYSSTLKLNDKKYAVQMDETNVSKDSTTKTTTMYAYDKWDDKGNWTEQTITENGKPKKIVVRTITYKQ